VGFEVRKQGEKGWHHVLDRTIGRCKDLGSWIVVDPVFVKKKRFERELGLDNLGHQNGRQDVQFQGTQQQQQQQQQQEC
jgi:hypothetical protein